MGSALPYLSHRDWLTHTPATGACSTMLPGKEEQSLAFLRAVATKRWDQLTRAPQPVKDKVFCTAFGHPWLL